MTVHPMIRRDTCPPSALETFLACAHQMLDPVTPEAVRRSVEPRLTAQLATVRALGLFELFEVRDASLRAWLEDELEALAVTEK